MYTKKPKMILFDVGGTLFKGGNFSAENGFRALLRVAENPDIINEKILTSLWDKYIAEVCSGLKSKTGIGHGFHGIPSFLCNTKQMFVLDSVSQV